MSRKKWRVETTQDGCSIWEPYECSNWHIGFFTYKRNADRIVAEHNLWPELVEAADEFLYGAADRKDNFRVIGILQGVLRKAHAIERGEDEAEGEIWTQDAEWWEKRSTWWKNQAEAAEAKLAFAQEQVQVQMQQAGRFMQERDIWEQRALKAESDVKNMTDAIKCLADVLKSE